MLPDIVSSGVEISTVHIMRSISLDPRPMMARSDSIHSSGPGSTLVLSTAGMISGERLILDSLRSTRGGIQSPGLEIAMSDGV